MVEVEIFHNSVLKSCSYCVYDNITLEGYVIDAGDATPICGFITKNQIKVKGIFLTHPHFDHVYGVIELVKHFPSAPLYCSLETLEGLHNENVNMSYMFLDDIFRIPDGTIIMVIDENSHILCFGCPIHIIPCPGHDSGSLSFVFGKCIFTGDSYIPFAPVTYNWRRSDKQLAIKSESFLIEIVNSKGLRVFPGHYQ